MDTLKFFINIAGTLILGGYIIGLWMSVLGGGNPLRDVLDLIGIYW